jgi:archaellum component FlaC
MEGRLQKEEQNLKMLNTKVNSLASRSSDGKKTPDSSEGTDALAKEIQALKMALQELKDQVSNLTSLKAPKTDVNRIAGRVNELEDLLKLLSTKIDGQQKSAATRSEQALGTAGPGQEVPAGELSDLRILVNTHASMIDNLFADKASRDTVVRMGTELQDIKAMLESRPRMPSITAAVGSGGVDSQALEGILQMLEELQRKIKGLEDGKADKDWVESQFKKLASIVENIQLNKADASIVAGKAERDYVENALEKLRREVEQVMNNTNSGLIDTLDKSLNILRDMIDGKANHAELLKLRDALLSERKQDDTPEGLAGYKHYRCLSCNRKMDGMRPRPMGMNFMNFISHLPNPRTKQYTNSKVHNQTNLITASVQSSARAITASAEGEHGAASLPPIAAPDYVQPAPNSAPAGAGPM